MQRIAARHEFWNSKLQHLDQQRDRVRQNTVNSIQVAQHSFSAEVLLATQRNKSSSKVLHMQRKVESARSSCNFNVARRLEEELQIMLVRHVVFVCSVKVINDPVVDFELLIWLVHCVTCRSGE
jgi:hypothetical protein